MSAAYKRKKALIIGIDSYRQNPLKYCVNDAEDLKTTLKRVGFDVSIGLNCHQTKFYGKIDKFVEELQSMDLALFYFAGHGKQNDDQNYLLPAEYDYDYRGSEHQYLVDHAINVKYITNAIDKKKFYHHDPPTITQKRTILDIANNQQKFAIKDLEPTTTSMVIIDQLPSTIRRTTINKCLLTEDILSSNIQDLDKDSITKILPEQDRELWIRLIDHFTRLVKYHIMTSQTLANKFAPILLPNNMLYLHDKAKSLLQHIVEKLVGKQS